MVQIRDTSGQDRVIDNRPQKRRRVIIGTALLLSAVATAVWMFPSVQQFSASEHTVSRERLRFATVQQGAFVRDISVTGQAVAAVRPTLYSSAPGTVTLSVQAGEQVQQGQLLAQIDSPELKNRWQQESASLTSLTLDGERETINARQESLRLQQTVDLARVSFEAAQRELARAEQSWQKQLISRQDFERRQDEVASAKLALDHASQDAQLAEERLAFEARARVSTLERQQLVVDELQRQLNALSVHSPVNGIVGNLQIAQKEVVALNQALLTVVDLSALEVELNIPETYAEELAPGMELAVSYRNTDYNALLSTIAPEVSQGQVIARARFSAEAPAQLKQNQRVSARIVLAEKDQATIVERGPFLSSAQGSVAYVVDGNYAHRRAIQTGASSINSVEVLQGLALGEQIILSDLSEFGRAETIRISQ
ncbi:MAG: efflux RND transporter periplasmic adaptor subunit [Xanthomonadales bacterium]|nr:efflux RND transporter periplasmic adaptor subunit [Xanthomonadales bacterium]